MRIKFVAALAAMAFAVIASSASAASAKCVTVYDFPDAGEKVCVFSDGPCLLGEYRTTFLGTEFNCTVARPGSRSDASAAANPIPPCVQIVLANAPGFALSTIRNLVENGELPRLMGPFLPC